MNYFFSVPIEVRQTEDFANWLDALRDRRAADRVVTRILRAQGGNLGDVKYFGGIGEMRIDYGSGYRLYFVKKGYQLLLLLCGGDKTTQKRDIERAREMVKET